MALCLYHALILLSYSKARGAARKAESCSFLASFVTLNMKKIDRGEEVFLIG